MSSRMLITAVRPGARLTELTIDLGVDKQAFVAVRTFREVLARLSRVDELTRTILISALGPERAPNFGSLFAKSKIAC